MNIEFLTIDEVLRIYTPETELEKYCFQKLDELQKQVFDLEAEISISQGI